MMFEEKQKVTKSYRQDNDDKYVICLVLTTTKQKMNGEQKLSHLTVLICLILEMDPLTVSQPRQVTA